MTLVGSYTLLSTFERCKRQAQHRYVLKDTPFTPTEASTWGNRVHEAMENALKRGDLKLPQDMLAYERHLPPLKGSKAELKLGVRENWSPCGFFDSDVFFRTKIDVVMQAGATAAIVDWKTGKRREDADELEINAALLKAHHPELEKITGWYVWLKDDALGKEHDLSGAAGKQAEISRRMSVVRQSEQMNYWPPTENALCGWCDVRGCEFRRERR